MNDALLHTLHGIREADRPLRFTFPFSYVPHPWAQAAAEEVMADVRSYMQAHPESELHRLGKMFGILVVQTADGRIAYLRAFSAMLDASYHHEGFVGPVFDISDPDGYFKQEEAHISAINRQIKEAGKEADCTGVLRESMRCSAGELASLKTERKQRSQALQRWMFSQYRMLNGLGQEQDLLTLFSHEKPILTEEEFYNRKDKAAADPSLRIPPSGAGECCAPKLLQAAYAEGLTPLCMAEFWMGASPRSELRIEGQYYPACQSKCKPILRHMLQGITLDEDPIRQSCRSLAEEVSVLYEDDFLMAVSKPSGLLTAPGTEDVFSLTDRVRELSADGVYAPVHRLDMDTSGIVVFAKTKEAYTTLQTLFQSRQVEKRYEAVVRPLGAPIADQGIITLPLNRDPFDRPRQRVDAQHGKTAITHYRVEERRSDGTVLIHLFPHTGRTHQLRVHCAHPEGLCAPILGDRLYGDCRTAPRLLLHAAEIRFIHPVSGKEIHLTLPSHF